MFTKCDSWCSLLLLLTLCPLLYLFDNVDVSWYNWLAFRGVWHLFWVFMSKMTHPIKRYFVDCYFFCMRCQCWLHDYRYKYIFPVSWIFTLQVPESQQDFWLQRPGTDSKLITAVQLVGHGLSCRTIIRLFFHDEVEIEDNILGKYVERFLQDGCYKGKFAASPIQMSLENPFSMWFSV